jgi:hypothetical protein
MLKVVPMFNHAVMVNNARLSLNKVIVEKRGGVK